MVDTKRTSVVLSALQVTLRILADMPECAETDVLRKRIADCESETKLWKSTSPTSAEREAVMKRVLWIHTAVAKLARERAPAK
jgi:hypothetical protein